MSERKEVIKNLKSISVDPRCIVGPSYQEVHKTLASLYFEEEKEQLGIYHLTETHAASLRMRTVIQYNSKKAKVQITKSKNVEQGINKEYVRFDSELAKQEEKGLLKRLKEMPKQWTLVQVTQEYDSKEEFSQNWKTKPSRLHISRLPCGSELKFNVPVCVTVEKPRGSDENMPFSYSLIDDAVNNKISTRNLPAKLIRKMRDEGANQIKAAVTEISEGWLREWRCLFLGELYNTSYKEQVINCIKPYTEGKILSAETCHKLYAIANGCAHLSSQEISFAVAKVVSDFKMSQDIVQSILKLKTDVGQLMLAKRHPVLLIVEEKLDLVPWEMISILMRHPVTRVPSVHFAHALYKEHQAHIVDGNRMIHQSDLGFYIINPDNDLGKMETKLLNFLERRVPEWKGISGVPPSPEEFASALKENKLILYCGHGSGTNLLQGKQIEDLQVVALPLLFGCSSAQLQHPGGCAQFSGTSHNYLIAGSASVLGMLWAVTSQDTDAMTAMLLNSWLPGEPIDLSDFRKPGEIAVGTHEPELLRVMKPSRSVAYSYANAAALVSRGIPIKMSVDPKQLPIT